MPGIMLHWRHMSPLRSLNGAITYSKFEWDSANPWNNELRVNLAAGTISKFYMCIPEGPNDPVSDKLVTLISHNDIDSYPGIRLELEDSTGHNMQDRYFQRSGYTRLFNGVIGAGMYRYPYTVRVPGDVVGRNTVMVNGQRLFGVVVRNISTDGFWVRAAGIENVYPEVLSNI